MVSLVTSVRTSSEDVTGCRAGWYPVRQYPNPLPVIGPRPKGPVLSNPGINYIPGTSLRTLITHMSINI